MGGRYILSGAQIGMLIGLPTKKLRKEFYDEDLERQFIGNSKNSIINDCKKISKFFEEEK